MKTTLLFLSVLVFVSCSNNDSQIEELQNQTKKLEKRIDQLQPNDSKNNEISEIKTKELINEIDDTKQSDFDEKEITHQKIIDNKPLADHFRNWLIKEEYGLTRYDFLMTPSQAKKVGNWDDLNKLWALPGVRNRYAMDAEGWYNAKAKGISGGGNTNELNQVLSFKVN
jgi:hypothetical protein